MAAAAADRATRSPSMSSSSDEDDQLTIGGIDFGVLWLLYWFDLFLVCSASTIGNYDPAHYEHLKVSPEIKELFSHITKSL
jgi:hypothetical protein